MMGIRMCELKLPNYATYHCKSQIKYGTQTTSRARFMTMNSKANYLLGIFTSESNIKQTISKNEMKKLGNEIEILKASDDNETLSDFLLDCKNFYGGESVFDKFW